MSINFEVFRLSAIRRRPPDLLEQLLPSRSSVLRQLFGNPIPFRHYGAEYLYAPYSPTETRPYIVGKIGRHIETTEDKLTDRGFVSEPKDEWRAAFIVFDPDDGPLVDGQRVAVERTSKIGSTQSVLSSLVDAINRSSDLPYLLVAEPIFDAKTFWDFLAEHPHDITRLTFEFVAPNGFWNVDKSIRELVAEENARFNAEKVTHTLSSQDGLRLKKEDIEDEVSYAESGSGRITARTKSKRTYRSHRKSIVTSVDTEESSDLNLSQLLSKIGNRILGRE